jgi:hypothetical protein
MTSKDFSASFSVSNLSTNQQGSCFWIQANPKTESLDYEIPMRGFPDVFRRAAFAADPLLLVAISPDLGSRIRITFFSPPVADYHAILDQALNACKRELKIPLDLQIQEEKFEFDAVTLQIAIDSYYDMNLEALGWWRLRQDSKQLLLRGNGHSGFSQGNITLNSKLAAHALQSFSGFSKAAKSNQIMTSKDPISVSVISQVRFLTLRRLRDSLEKSQIQQFTVRGEVRLDSIPCTVLPNCSQAFAVRYSREAPQELISYWKYVHGIDLQCVNAVFHVTFVQGNEDATLTYPELCVMEVFPFLEKPLRKVERELEEFVSNFQFSLETIGKSLAPYPGSLHRANTSAAKAHIND